MSPQENQLKFAKYLWRSFDMRWSSSRIWEEMSEEVRNGWLAAANELIAAMEDKSDKWRDPYWPW